MYSNASNGSVTRIGVGIGFSGNSSMKAVGHYSNGTQLDLSNLVSWTSSNTNTSTISTTGLARGVAPGTAIMTAPVG